MFEKTWWVGLPAHELEQKKIYQGDLNGRFAYYRCTVRLQKGAHLTLNLTANARYRLWVNERPVCSGPCKGDLNRWYYDTADVTEYLQSGDNLLAVQVLFMDHYSTTFQEDTRSPIFSVAAPGGTHRLAVEGVAHNPDGSTADIGTGTAEWKCFLDGSRFVTSQEPTMYMGATCEEITFDALPHRWKQADFDDSGWGQPEKLEPVLPSAYMLRVGLMQRFLMRERPIPPMYETDCTFAQPGQLKSPVTLPAKSRQLFLLDAGAEVNGYPVFQISGGKGSTVQITYLEKFTGPHAANKADPNGEISGITDTLHLNGDTIRYEPFWYRTFRFIAIQAEAAEEMTIFPPTYRKTGYPLRRISGVQSSESWVQEVYDICVRTLENCMMETYMDCPYYEQNQFPMDTRLQALFCSAVSGDTRLTCKALEEFHSCITPDGLVHGRYPASYQQIISTFSLHYIFMLEETWQQTGDLEPLRRYLPDLDRILDYYDRHIGKDGLVGRLGWWEFVDWLDEWMESAGTPEALLHGPSSIINLMYALALERGAVLWDAAGRESVAAEYRKRKAAILQKVDALCWDSAREMVREGPDFAQFTQHAQSWAVLTGMLQGDRAKAAMLHAIQEEDVLKCSFSTSYELFRALEAAGLYNETRRYMQRWAELPQQGNTTCPETPENSRSECHAWSALPIYEFLRVMSGVRMEAGKAVITPMPGYLHDLSGSICIPGGTARFTSTGDSYTVTLSPGTEAVLHAPDGNCREITGGQTYRIQLQ